MRQAETVVSHKDVVIAILGVSAGLSGLVLVFLGLVLTSLGTYGAAIPEEVRRPYQRLIFATVVVFSLGMACVMTASSWLWGLEDDHLLYVTMIALFIVQVLALSLLSGWTAARLALGR